MDKNATIEQRNKRGEWDPGYKFSPPPIYAWPPRPTAVLKWFFAYPGYLWPWAAIYMTISVGVWLFLTPNMDSMKNFAVWWIAAIFLRNVAIVCAVVGAWHFWLYIKKAQGLAYKYTSDELATDSAKFKFRNQTYDNIFFTFVSGLPIWTAYECLTLWAYSNNYIPYVNIQEHPIYFVIIALLVIPIHETHFYIAHRILHHPRIYKKIHALHHKNINVGPWSGLSMHPIEHLIFFSAVFLHWIIPSHPLLAIFQMQVAGLSPSQGHTGFDEILVGKHRVKTGGYFHYLHHKLFEVNYGSDGVVVLDKLLGTFHDGSPASQQAMILKRKSRSAKKISSPLE